MTIADTLPETERRAIAGRWSARYARAVTLCAKHILNGDDKAAERIDRMAREAARKACQYGHTSPLIDRLERALGIDEDDEDA